VDLVNTEARSKLDGRRNVDINMTEKTRCMYCHTPKLDACIGVYRRNDRNALKEAPPAGSLSGVILFADDVTT
jgi:hypothetical protein